MSEQTKPIPTEKQLPFTIAEMLFALETPGTAVLTAAMSGPKIPPFVGD